MSRIHLTDQQWACIRPPFAAPSPHGAPAGGRPPGHRGHPLHPYHRLPLAGPTTRVRRANHGLAAAQALGRGGHLGAHLAGGDKVGLTKKGKGTKWMLVVDGNGLPLGFHLDSASLAEVRLAERTLDTVRVARPRGRPKQRPAQLIADRGYDSRAFRAALRRCGIRMCTSRDGVRSDGQTLSLLTPRSAPAP